MLGRGRFLGFNLVNGEKDSERGCNDMVLMVMGL